MEQQLDLVTERLTTKFGRLPGEKVVAAVHEAEAGMRSARIRDFVPVLVEKQARDWLAAEVGRLDEPGGGAILSPTPL